MNEKFRHEASVQAISLLIKEHTVHPTMRGAVNSASWTCWLQSLWTWEVRGRTGRSFSSPKIGSQPTSVLERTSSRVPDTEACCWRSAGSTCLAGLRGKHFSVCGIMSTGNRNRMSKSLETRLCLKLNNNVLKQSGFQYYW